MVNQASEFNEIYDLVGIRILTESDARLLRRTRHDPQQMEADTRAVQGLHRDAEVQPLPVAAHHGHRSRRQAGRDADPLVRDAQQGRVRRRGALEVQGPRHARERRTKSPAPTTSAGYASSPTGRRRPGTRPSSSSRCGSRSTPSRSTSSPRGAGHRAARRAHAGRLRLPRAHRGRAPHGRRPGQQPPGRAGVPLSNGDVVEIFTTKAANAGAEPRLARLRQSRRAPARRSGSYFTRERRDENIDRGKDQIAELIRKAGPSAAADDDARVDAVVARDLHYADVSSLYAAVGEGNLTPRRGRPPARPTSARPPACRTRTRPRSATRDRDRPASARARPPASWSRHGGHLGEARQVLYAGARRRRGRLRHQGIRRFRAPQHLYQRRGSSSAPATASSRSTGHRRRPRVPRQHAGRGARPRRAAQRHLAGAERPARRHPAMSLTTTRDRTASIRFTIEMADMTHLGHVQAAVRTSAASTTSSASPTDRASCSVAQAENSSRVFSTSVSHACRALRASCACRSPDASPLVRLSATSRSRSAMVALSRSTVSLARALVSGLVRRHSLTSEAWIASSTRRSRASMLRTAPRGTLPMPSQRPQDVAEGASRALRWSRTGSSASASASRASFWVTWLASNSASCSANVALRAVKNRSWAVRKRFHSWSSTSRGCSAGGLPAAHQFAVTACSPAPVGGVGERLGFGGEVLLDLPGVLALGVELGEVLLAVTGVGRAGAGEPVPQLVVGGLVEPRQSLPLVEQLPEAADPVSPVGTGGEASPPRPRSRTWPAWPPRGAACARLCAGCGVRR